ncbi:MAG: glycosyltransferase [Lachnospiraceae bacterium]|jgi:Glycosyltransferases involved in cell wall biogenesis|nr:glycosyltransferase [Lachnospiraceae bacterium]
MPLFSIITVCYNEGLNIERTIKSVEQQKYHNFEYIIIDGKSVDQTISIIESHKKLLEKKLNFILLSEQDEGIYNAMNKGITLASGKWLLFLNAGDYFYDEYVLEKVSKYDCENIDIIYGDYISQIYNLYMYRKCLSLNEMKVHMPFCHQSVFILNSIIKNKKYNEIYRIASDYDFFLSCYCEKKNFKYIELPVSVFVLDGTSSDSVKLYKETLDIRFKQGVLSKEDYYYLLSKLKRKRKISKIKKQVKKIIPDIFVKNIRILKYKKAGYKKEFPLN